MLSHDTRLRCELVDLYYTLYGKRRPTCLPIPELAGVLNLHKYDMKKIKSIAPIQKPATITSLSEFKKNPPPPQKQGPSDIIIENLECINVEVVSREVKVKVMYRPSSHMNMKISVFKKLMREICKYCV